MSFASGQLLPVTEKKSNRVFLYVATGAGAGVVASAIAAILFHQAASSAVDAAKAVPTNGCAGSPSPACAQKRELRDDRDGADTRTTAALITGGGLAALGGVFLWLGLRRSEGAARIAPVVGPNHAAFDLRITF